MTENEKLCSTLAEIAICLGAFYVLCIVCILCTVDHETVSTCCYAFYLRYVLAQYRSQSTKQ